MQKSLRNLSAIAFCLSCVPQAFAAIASPTGSQTFTQDAVTSSFGTGGTTNTFTATQTTVPSNYTDRTYGVPTYQSVLTPSTTTTAGSVDFYENKPYIDTTYTSSYSYDKALYNVAVNSPTQSANQYILLAGTVTASSATNLSFLLGSGGTYSSSTSTFSPLPSSLNVAPALPIFGLVNSQGSAVSLNTLTSTYGTSFSQTAGSSVHLAAGESYSFQAYVYSQSPQVALNRFSLVVTGDDYGITSSTSQSTGTLHTLLASQALPLIPAVPEPETYSMLLAGIGLVGAAARRRKGKQA